MPTYPRKHLTISIIGPWSQIIDSKEMLLSLSKKFIMQHYRSYEHFHATVFHQQIRFAFKSLKRYILEKDIKYLSHWDIVSVFIDSIGQDFKVDLNEKDLEVLIQEKQKEMLMDSRLAELCEKNDDLSVLKPSDLDVRNARLNA